MDRFIQQIEEFSKAYFNKSLLNEEGEGEDEVENKQEDGIDILDQDQESALDEVSTPSPDLSKVVLLTNILLKSLKFKPSFEVEAYLNMPRFIDLDPHEKITVVRNLLSDHPEKIVQEADEEVSEFGDEQIELDEQTEMDFLKLILKAMNVNPHGISHGIGNLPSKANEENYQEVVEKIEAILI